MFGSVCNRAKHLKLRGSCPEEGLDHNYQLTSFTKNDRYVIRGLKFSNLEWDLETSSWRILNLRNKKMIAYTNDSNDYPLGTHKWVFPDGRCKDKSQNRYRRMNLHSCLEVEFICNDGQCIDIRSRCNSEYNCHDFSDEENCTLFTAPNYDKDSPPTLHEI